ncbi:hypothetical protein FOIG_05611 [Fusarium odoratissimum NRRL 54006]|uniref:Uncharacterized protein n=2 Tax=Fusarium oxysporum species complex TaxID=171631 RepID=X0K5X6_FUSO5|nr:uncharacterized protein FOIG_05611 [Fusarium odoratissimum NRRL 54006]EXM04041.1 hypothetical protein FOIG_05611 [Fusarium odoratissimum NRRL 54006]TXC09110.1 hypothetical protein FocTR4_00005596 [Fusarium oxysporum f. sp. cubense]
MGYDTSHNNNSFQLLTHMTDASNTRRHKEKRSQFRQPKLRLGISAFPVQLRNKVELISWSRLQPNADQLLKIEGCLGTYVGLLDLADGDYLSVRSNAPMVWIRSKGCLLNTFTAKELKMNRNCGNDCKQQFASLILYLEARYSFAERR